MNERIKQLILEAGFPQFGKMYVVSDGEELERFAELIVQECVKESMEEIVPDEDIAQEYDPSIREFLKGNNQGIVDAVVRFRNHFGVEE